MLIIIFITSSPIESVKCPTDYSLSSDNSMCLSDFEGLQNPEIEPNRGLYLLDNISFGAFLFGLSIMMHGIVKMYIH